MAIKTTENLILDDRLTIGFNTQSGTFTIKIDGVTVYTSTSTAFTQALAQTITGITTFSTMFRIPVGADVAAAGTNQATAAALAEGFQVVTGADGTKGVVLPTGVAGAVVIIKGTTAAVLKVYPASGGTINALSQDAAMSLASGVIPAILIAKSATQWYTLPLLPS